MKPFYDRIINLFKHGLLLCTMVSCESFLDVTPPKSKIASNDVFNNAVTANLALVGIYASMLESPSFANGDASSITTLAGLSADELVNYPRTAVNPQEFDENDLSAQNTAVLGLWVSIYKIIYMANAAIDGLDNSTSVSYGIKSQLKGEALFIRAFCYFYIVNLFGDAPLIISTDYTINAKALRTPKQEIYEQIIEDLITAKELMNENYAETQRIRPNRAVATAMLARVYLYVGDWVNAESESTLVIDNPAYSLNDLDNIFLANSYEAIWQLRPGLVSGSTGYTNEAYFFTPSVVLNNNVLNMELVNAFETGDGRFDAWVRKYTTIYHPYKYKQNIANAPLTEYSMVMRLAEQYLIRAEARAHQDKLTGLNSAESDINSIRNRAGLGNISALSLDQILSAIEQERRVELFTEWGHRWLDLKRTGRADAVLKLLKPKWNPQDVLYPLPQTERNKNPNLKPQNPGY